MYGMHIGANESNIGLDATYMQALISTTQESWPGWEVKDDNYTLHETSTGKFARTPKGYMKLDDKYFEELKARANGSWADMMAEYLGEAYRPVPMEQHDNSESGNASRAAMNEMVARALASKQPGAFAQQNAETQEQSLILEAVSSGKAQGVMPGNPQRESLTVEAGSCPEQSKPEPSMVSQMSTAAPSTEVLLSIIRSMTASDRLQLYRKQRKLEMQCKRSQTASGQQDTTPKPTHGSRKNVEQSIPQEIGSSSRPVYVKDALAGPSNTPLRSLTQNRPPVTVSYRNEVLV